MEKVGAKARKIERLREQDDFERLSKMPFLRDIDIGIYLDKLTT